MLIGGEALDVFKLALANIDILWVSEKDTLNHVLADFPRLANSVLLQRGT
jgi:hypothetical protein